MNDPNILYNKYKINGNKTIQIHRPTLFQSSPIENIKKRLGFAGLKSSDRFSKMIQLNETIHTPNEIRNQSTTTPAEQTLDYVSYPTPIVQDSINNINKDNSIVTKKLKIILEKLPMAPIIDKKLIEIKNSQDHLLSPLNIHIKEINNNDHTNELKLNNNEAILRLYALKDLLHNTELSNTNNNINQILNKSNRSIHHMSIEQFRHLFKDQDPEMIELLIDSFQVKESSTKSFYKLNEETANTTTTNNTKNNIEKENEKEKDFNVSPINNNTNHLFTDNDWYSPNISLNTLNRNTLQGTIDSRALLMDICRTSASLDIEDKMRFVFNLFDTKKNNKITKQEVIHYLSIQYNNNSFIQLNGTTFNNIVDIIFDRFHEINNNNNNNNNNLINKNSIYEEDGITFEQFKSIFSNSMKPLKRNLSEFESNQFNTSNINNKIDPIIIKKHPKLIKYYIKNKKRIQFLCIYFIINLIAFLSKCFEYSHDPVAKYSTRIAKGCAQIVMVNTVFVLLPMCRDIMSLLRKSSILWKYISFDDNIEFHKIAAYVLLLASLGHTCAWIFIIYNARYTTLNKWRRSKLHPLTILRNGSIYHLLYQIPIITGILMILIAMIAVPMTHPKIRKGNFNSFWITHMLFIPFLILLAIHGAAQWVDSPQSFWWMLFPIVIYFIERRYRFGKIFGGSSKIIDVHLTSDTVAVYLTKPMSFENTFLPGMYLYINVPTLSRYEWHPFTISSAPEDKYLSLHIRAAGDWTNAFYHLMSNIKNKSNKSLFMDPKNIHNNSLLLLEENVISNINQYPEVILDGPIGAPTQDYIHYKVLMFIGAGIGVTPFASILKSIMNTWEDYRCMNCNTIRLPRNFKIAKIYFYWVTREQDALNWFSDTMNQLSILDFDNRLEIHNYLTPIQRKSVIAPLQLFQTFMHKEDGHDIISGLNTKTLTHFGRPKWNNICNNIALSHPNETIGMFLCGPPKMDKELSNLCHKYNLTKKNGVKFSYHSENF